MRRTSTLLGLGASLLAAPALAHVGDHGEHGAAHFMANHGIAAGLVALVILGSAAVYFMRRKG